MASSKCISQKPIKSVLTMAKKDNMLKTATQTQRENPRTRKPLKRQNKLAGKRIKY